jgi:hypothetical protein
VFTPPGSPTLPIETEFQSVSNGTAKNASPIPLILLILAIIVSGGIAFFIKELGEEWWSLVGYALTPLFGVVAVGWDALAQLSGRKNPWFVIRPGLSRAIRIVAAISIALGVIHIWRISEWVARTAVQQGWPFLT